MSAAELKQAYVKERCKKIPEVSEILPNTGWGQLEACGEARPFTHFGASVALSLELSPADLVIITCFCLLDGGVVYDTVLPLC